MTTRRSAAVLAALAAFAAAPSGAAASTSCPNADIRMDQAPVELSTAATACLLNEQRAAAGLPPLAINAQLTASASAYASELVAGQFFAHVSPSGETLGERVTRSGYTKPQATWVVGENLGWALGTSATPTSMMDAWMASPSHRENILDSQYRELGVGAVTGVPVPGGASGETVVTHFGMRTTSGGDAADSSSDDAAVTPASANQKSKREARAKAKARRAKARKARAARARKARAARAHKARAAGARQARASRS